MIINTVKYIISEKIFKKNLLYKKNEENFPS